MNPIVLAICFPRDAGGSQQLPGRETPKCHLARGRDCLSNGDERIGPYPGR